MKYFLLSISLLFNVATLFAIQFKDHHTITTSANNTQSIFAIDLDGDGDVDILSASKDDNTIAWYRNDGSENFTKIDITTSANNARSVFAIDLDGDGDIDVLSASEVWDNGVNWHENNGNESFTNHSITTTADYPSAIYASDIDDDGNIDILAAGNYNSGLHWYKNDGNNNFTDYSLNENNNYSDVFAIDLDGDGDMDVLSSPYDLDQITWHENVPSDKFHVSTTGNDTNSGSSSLPFKTIQKAINTAYSLDTILVQPGRYKEIINYNSKSILIGSLYLTTNDTLYIDSTIIDGNDIDTSIVTFNNGSNGRLSGFTIQNSGKPEYGGGIYCYNSSPVLDNLLISSNEAIYNGGGIYMHYQSNPKITDLKIINNESGSHGGGVYINNHSSPIFKNVSISNNASESEGGGLSIYDQNSAPTFINLRVIGNEAEWSGGGIIIAYSNPTFDTLTVTDNEAEHDGGGISIYSNQANPIIKNATLNGNKSNNGGGLSISSGSNPQLTNINIFENEANDRGGGIYIVNNATEPIITNTRISNNIAYHGAGIAIQDNSEPTFSGLQLIDNKASYDGGGIYMYDDVTVSFTDVIIANNTARYYGGGLYTQRTSNVIFDHLTAFGNTAIDTMQNSGNYNKGGFLYSNPDDDEDGCQHTIKNSILWNNKPEEIFIDEYSEQEDDDWINSILNLSYSNIQFGQENITTYKTTVNWLEGNINNDPLFCNWDSNDYSLGLDSPSYGTGENGSSMGAILVSNCTIGTVGPYRGPKWYVSPNGSDLIGFGNEFSPYKTIQFAIDQIPIKYINSIDTITTQAIDTILVKPGTYYENISINNKPVVIISSDGYESTIIDGSQSGRVIQFSGENIDTTTIVSGFTITNGAHASGAGIYIQNWASPKISNCKITENYAYLLSAQIIGGGGGIFTEWNCNFILEHSILSYNNGQYSGAISSRGTDKLRYVDIINNSTISGSIINFEGGENNVFLDHVTISDNHILDDTWQKIIDFSWIDAVIHNSLIYNNYATGGVIQSGGTSNNLIIDNSTFFGNLTNDGSHGGNPILNTDQQTFVNISNSIFWNPGRNELEDKTVFITVLNSAFENGMDGTNNISTDPLFCDPHSGDFTLAQNSPCIGSGQNGTNIGGFDTGCESPVEYEYSLSFNENNYWQKVYVDDDIREFIGQDAFTFMAWIKIREYPDSFENNPSVIFQESKNEWDTRTSLEINYEGRVRTFTDSVRDDYNTINNNWETEDTLGFGNFISNAILDTNQWYHVAYVGGVSYRKLYINGELDKEISGSYDKIQPDQEYSKSWITFGSGYHNPRGYYKGNIDEIALWTTALSKEEIESFMAMEYIGSDPDLLGYWKIQTVWGTTVYDVSGNDHHGIFHDSEYPSWSRDIPIDCNGVLGGAARNDCMGECNGSAVIDCNDICGGDAIIDCENNCNGNAYLDDCNVCSGGNTFHVADSDMSECGVCFSDYNCEPILLSNEEDFTSISLRDSMLSFEFSIPMDTLSFSGITLQSAVNPNMAFHTEIDTGSTKIVHLIIESDLASRDTLTVGFPSTLQSSFNYSFDGNQDGIPGDALRFTIYTETLADYNHDGQIDINDLSIFTSNWYNKNFIYELGPVLGSTPNFIPAFDSTYNIEDMSTLMLMWNWANGFASPRMSRYAEVNESPTIKIKDDFLGIDLSPFSNISTMRIQISTFSSDISLDDISINSTFDLSIPRKWEEQNIYEWNFANLSEKDIDYIDICQLYSNLTHNQEILIDYKINSLGGEILSSGSISLEYIPIPKEFIFQPAYPNPFNPTTLLKYGLSEDMHVNILIYDILGREVSELLNSERLAGYHQVTWNGNQNASGLYFVKMTAGDFISTQKLMLMK